MSNNDISVQATSGPAYVLYHPDGSEVTAQEAYDAYMAGGIRLRMADSSNLYAYFDVIEFFWADADGAQNDPSSVVYCALTTLDTTYHIGEAPRPPK